MAVYQILHVLAFAQMYSVARDSSVDEMRFLQWTRSIGLARSDDYRAFKAECELTLDPYSCSDINREIVMFTYSL